MPDLAYIAVMGDSDIAENANTQARHARQLAALKGAWAGAYHIAVAGGPGGGETWTALPERAPRIRVVTAGTADDMAHALYRDAAAHPPARLPQRPPMPDSLVGRVRADCPGWAVVSCQDGICAARGGVLIGPMRQGVAAQVRQAEHEMARAATAALHPGSWQWRQAQRQPGAGPAT